MAAGGLDVVYCFDDYLALPGAVSVLSLLRHNPEARVHVLTDPAPRAAPLLKAIAAATGSALRIIDAAPERRRGFNPESDYGGASTAAYRRLFLPELLPDLDRVLYLDADTIVRGALDALWRTDLGDAPLGAVDDPWMLTLPNMERAFPQGYFNAGVMLADLDQWRRERLTEAAVAQVIRLASTASAVNGVSVGHKGEQTPLNIVTHGRWRRLSPRYNCTALTLPRMAPRIGLSAANMAEALADPAIAHFLAAHKPWLLQYRAMSPWHEEFQALREELERDYDLAGLAWPGPFTNGPKSVAARAMMALQLVQKALRAEFRRPTVFLSGLLAGEVCRVAKEQGLPVAGLVTDYPAYQGRRMDGVEICSIDDALARGDNEFILADYRRQELFQDILKQGAAARGVEIRLVALQSDLGGW